MDLCLTVVDRTAGSLIKLQGCRENDSRQVRFGRTGTSIEQNCTLMCKALTTFLIELHNLDLMLMSWNPRVPPSSSPEMGTDWVQLEASSRGQQPLSGQPQRQDGRTHCGGLQPEPQPAMEVHPQFTIIGAVTDPGKIGILVKTPTDSEACKTWWKKNWRGKTKPEGLIYPSHSCSEVQPVRSMHLSPTLKKKKKTVWEGLVDQME